MPKTKKCTKCNNYKYLDKFYKSKNGKFGVTGRCIFCVKKAQRHWRDNNKEKIKLLDRNYSERNRKKITERKLDWAKRNPDKMYLSRKRWRDKNPELCKKYQTRHSTRRDKLVRKHTPSWADPNVIKDVYRECRRISRKTGILHHVDHIIPLQAKNVSGLHCVDNLQIIPAIDNLRKNNKVI